MDDYPWPDNDLDAAVEVAKPFVYVSRAELYEAVHHANTSAKRAPCIIGKPGYPTKWDKAHAFINELLDTLVGR